MVYIRQGSGHKCAICKNPITKLQKQISFKGWNVSAIIHSDPQDCDAKKRYSKQYGGC